MLQIHLENLCIKIMQELRSFSTLSSCILLLCLLPSCFAKEEFLSINTSSHNLLTQYHLFLIVRYPCECLYLHILQFLSITSLLYKEYVYLNVSRSTLLNKFLGKSKINNVDNMCIFASSHKKIIRFNISMKYMFLMQHFDSINQLITYL